MRKTLLPNLPVTLTEPFHIKYRPTELSQIVGHGEVVKSLRNMLKGSSRPHTFLFTGAAGTGKTTLARILANEFRCTTQNIVEVDAAVTNGVDDMRALTDTMRYTGFGEQPNKMFIIDECHVLSKNAWGALLKACEEPPAHVYFCFCTNVDGKVPDTITSRSQNYNLKPLRRDDILDLLEYVCDMEEQNASKEVLNMIASACNGSPRTALTMLQKLGDCDDEKTAATLLEEPLEDVEVIELCRAMVNDTLTWKMVQDTIKGLNDSTAPESVRIMVVNYLNSCLLNEKNIKKIPPLLDMLHMFSKPCNPTDKWAGILLALGDFIFAV